ncbi:PAS domain-containing sensor histidine kinase [Flaviflagellibacter deserti]|uniref:histidine kinase n=1 Tax=Flaviflagellibacter deserti TaxID=2267266 RepID=A0ABV9YUM4_9HYPH
MTDAPTISNLADHPRIAAFADSTAPAFAVSAESAELIWANPAAETLFGHDGMSTALSDQIALVLPFVRRTEQPSPLSLRLNGSNSLSPCHAELLEGVDGGPAVLFSADVANEIEAVPEASEAVRAEPVHLPSRFVWQSDQNGQLVLLSDEIAAALDHDLTLVGRTWNDLCSEFDIDKAGKLASALTRRDTWSGVSVDWPLGRTRRVPAELAGLPVFDRERTFLGFRGFAVIRGEEFDAIEVRAEAATGDPEQAETETVRAEQEVLPHEERHEPPPLLPSPILPFRQPLRPGLKPSEHNAFQEIGRALGDRGTPSPPAEAKRISSASVSWPAPQPANQATASEPSAPTASDDDALRVLGELPSGIVIHRLGTPLFANKAFLAMAGMPAVEDLALHGLDRLFEERADAPGKLNLRSANGTVQPVQSVLKTTRWEGAAASLLVVTPEPQLPSGGAETANERELRSILDTATDGVIVVDRNGRIASANRSAEALFGYEAAELEGRSFTLLFSAESHRAALDYLDGLQSNGVASVLNDGREVVGVARKGGAIPLFMTLGRIGGGEPKFCAVLKDLTQFKKTEEELRTAKEQAERANAHKSDFLARISHEIRTPLNAILGFTEVMMEERFGPVGGARYKEYLKDIHESGSHIISLVNDLLDLAKIEAGKLDLSFNSVNLNEVVSGAVSLMQPQANQNRVIIRTSVAPRMPNVVGDLRSLKQIALNLVSNAVKYTPAGGQVIVSTAITDLGQAVIRVRDTGLGMNEAEIAAALEPFRQLAPASGRGGSGLGLPLTKALVEANRATFAIQSAVGTGTLVEVIFPPTRVLAE